MTFLTFVPLPSDQGKCWTGGQITLKKVCVKSRKCLYRDHMDFRSYDKHLKIKRIDHSRNEKGSIVRILWTDVVVGGTRLMACRMVSPGYGGRLNRWGETYL